MLSGPRLTAEIELTIPFHDVDTMGVAWHSNYFRYFGVAHEALFDQFSYSYRQMEESGYLWPVVDTQVKYHHALTFEQHTRVRAHIEEPENRLRIGYQIFNAEMGERATTGYTIQVAINEQSRGLCFVSPDIPSEHMEVKP